MAVVNVALVSAAISVPFSIHLYNGLEPQFTGFVVNVTDSPAHIFCLFDEIVRLGATI